MSLPSRRSAKNPLIAPKDVTPSREDFEVVGAFNPAAIRVGDETLLLLRVAEAPKGIPAGEVAAPMYDADKEELVIQRWKRGPGVDTRDPRFVVVDGHTYPTSISHFRLARSHDGERFEVETKPAFSASEPLEAFGVEDPRVTAIDGAFLVSYAAASQHGVAAALARTSDFRTFERLGVVFPPPNRHVALFPEKIGGKYVALHRPSPSGIGAPEIWVATSPDLGAWGNHRVVAGSRPGKWDDGKIGGGAAPFRVNVDGCDAWLCIYHGVTRSPKTCSLGALLLHGDFPAKVLGRSRRPILTPEASYEREGLAGDGVFTCGAISDGENVRVYYGAAETVTAVAELSLAALIAELE